MIASSNESTAKEVASVLELGRETASIVIGEVGPALKGAFYDTQRIVGGAVDKTTSQIRKHPVQAVLIGFGAGCLVGLLVRRWASA